MTASPSRAALNRGIAALSAGNLRDAETAVREALRDGESAAEAYFYLATTLRAQKRFDEAAEAAHQSFALHPLLATVYLGGEIAIARLDGQEAFEWADRLAHVSVKHVQRLINLGEGFAEVGLHKAAARCFEIALGLVPKSTDLLRRQCYCEVFHDPAKAIRVLQDFADRYRDTPHLACVALYQLLPYKEKALREERGLSPDGLDPSDLHFRLAQPEFAAWRDAAEQWLASAPDDPHALQMMASVRIAERRVRDAELYLERARVHRLNLATCANFSEAFLADAASAAERLGETLPDMETLVARGPQGPWVFMACDTVYFEHFGLVFARSFTAQAPKAHLHLHVFDLKPEDRAAFRDRLTSIMGSTSFSVTTEISGLAGTKDAACYYHAIRFIRLATLADRWAHPLCAFDADMIFNRSPDLLFDWFKDFDVGVAVLPGRMEASNQICANILGISPTKAGRDYLRRTAGYLALVRERGLLLWGMDQTAMFAVYADAAARGAAPRLISVPTSVYAGAYETDAIVWVGKAAPEHPDYARFTARRNALLAGVPPATT
jgi:tetratricopeptide (TPR) repeat protein